MRERWKKIRSGLLIIVFSVIGLLEYIQLMQSFDLPQMLLVIPGLSTVAMIVLKKWSLLVPVCTIFLSCVYQILAGENNAISELQTNAVSVAIILLQCLSILIVFQFLAFPNFALNIRSRSSPAAKVRIPCLTACFLKIRLVF